MNKIEIKNRFTNEVIFSHECEDNTLKITCMRAVLEEINLTYIDMSVANLRGADLSGADLRYVDLSGANLSGADLRYVDLSGADLRYVDLSGAAMVIYGMKWAVQITKNHITIGCQSHSLDAWINFNDKEISSMHSNALEFWKENKEFIINRCKELSK